jgi:hypothetical protein
MYVRQLFRLPVVPFSINTINNVELGRSLSFTRSWIATNTAKFDHINLSRSLKSNTMVSIKNEDITAPVVQSALIPLISEIPITETVNQQNVLPYVVSPDRSCNEEDAASVANLSCAGSETVVIPYSISNHRKPRLARQVQEHNQIVQTERTVSQQRRRNAKSLLRDTTTSIENGTNFVPEQFVHEIEEFPSSKKRKKNAEVPSQRTRKVNTDIPSPKRTPKQSPNKKATKSTVNTTQVNRTSSFGAVWSGSDLFQKRQKTETQRNLFNETSSPSFVPIVPPHTLILGTHPSIQSLSKGQYYGNPMK